LLAKAVRSMRGVGTGESKWKFRFNGLPRPLLS
jgi:hypothetical protein